MIDRPVAVALGAREWVRAMSGNENGGSEPHQFRCDDGRLYMVKAANNPQQGRVLVNELVGALALDWLGVSHPASALVDIPHSLLAISPGAVFRNGSPLAGGVGVGCEYWQSEPIGHVPIASVTNLADVAGTWVFDTWIQNHDSRQYRLKASVGEPVTYSFVPLDQGHSFGHAWTSNILNQQATTVAFASDLCALTGAIVHPFTARLTTFDNDCAAHLVAQVPDAWITVDERSALIGYLVGRAARAAEIIHERYPQ